MKAKNHKSRNIELVKTQKYDFVLYTATCDCGVSFTIEYDVVICRLNVRSITAGVVMQILHRCRNVKDRFLIIVQDNRCIDYDEHPGYSSRSYTQEEAVDIPPDENLSSHTSVKQVQEYLKRYGIKETYTWCNAKENLFIFTHKQKPFEVTVVQAMDEVTNPCKLNCNLRNAKRQKLDLTLKVATAINTDNWTTSDMNKHPELLEMCALAKQEEMNKNTNMIIELKDKMQLQGSRVLCTFAPEPADHDKNIEVGPKEAIQDAKLIKRNSIFDAEQLPFERLLEIHQERPQDRSVSYKFALSNAHMRATFGDDKIDGFRKELQRIIDDPKLQEGKYIMNIGDLTEIENQQLFRQLCNMTDRGHKGKLLDNSIKLFDQDYLNVMNPKHTAAQELANYENVESWGLSGPNDTSKAIIADNDEDRRDLMIAAVVRYQGMDTAKNKTKPNRKRILTQSANLIEALWSIRPSRGTEKGQDRAPTYTLKQTGKAKSFPDPSMHHLERYHKWYKKLNSPKMYNIDSGDDDDDDDYVDEQFEKDKQFERGDMHFDRRGLYDSDEEMGFESDSDCDRR